jgi:hypothetical protein
VLVLDTKSPKYLEMAQGHISLSIMTGGGELSFLELLLVVLSRLPLSRGTSFDFSFCADLML